MTEIDPLVHEPARLLLLTLLSGVAAADFNFLLSATEMTKGNLSSHLARLERAEYVAVTKSFRGKAPHTDYRLAGAGREALAAYWRQFDEIRALYDGNDHRQHGWSSQLKEVAS